MKKLFFTILLLTTNAFSMSLTAHTWLVADGNGKIIQSEYEKEQRSIAYFSEKLNDAKKKYSSYDK